MNTKFQIQIKICNWEGGSHTITKEISLNDLTKFANLVALINKNANRTTWNWFGRGKCLPDTWDGERYVLDTWRLCKHMKENFDYNVEDINLFKEFALRFITKGCDRIEYIKFFKVEEITETYV